MTLAHDLQAIAHQEKTLVLPRLDSDFVWQIGTQLREMAVARGAVLAIDIRTFGQRLFHVALDGTTPNNARYIERKAKTVEHFRCSSYFMGLKLQEAGATLAAKYALPEGEYASHGGAFPLSVAGAGVIGAVTVSGLPQRADHELVVEALAAVLGMDYSALALARE